MKTRVNVILNGHRELSKVINNLKDIVNSEDTLLLYTKSDKTEVVDELSKLIGDGANDIYFSKFNEYKDTDDFSKRIIVMKMPNNLYKSIPHAINDVLKFVDTTKIARFVHIFFDDIKINDNAKYSPTSYEWYMDKFNESFIIDAKMNRANFSFKKLSPRFIFVSKEIPSPVSFYQFEGKDHFIIDRENCKLNFDEKTKRLYMIEFIIRAFKNGIVKHLTFYPDPVLEEVFVRDNSFENTPGEKLVDDFRNDDKYIREELKYSITPESSVDPIIDYMSGILNSDKKDADNSVTPEVV